MGKKGKGEGSFREKMSELLELPKEIVLNLPKMVMIGNRQMMIENYKGIMEYEEYRVRINTSSGSVQIEGQGLNIEEITTEDILVTGDIHIIEFSPQEV